MGREGQEGQRSWRDCFAVSGGPMVAMWESCSRFRFWFWFLLAMLLNAFCLVLELKLGTYQSRSSTVRIITAPRVSG